MLYVPYGGPVQNGGNVGPTTTVGGTTTALKKFQSYLTNGTGTAVANPYQPSWLTTAVTDLIIPVWGTVNPGQTIPNGRVGGRRMIATVSGSLYVHGTSPTINFSLIGNLGNTPGTDVVMATLTSAQSLTTATSYDFTISASIYGNAAPASAGKVGGSGNLNVANCTAMINTTVVLASSMTLAALTGVDFNGQYGTNYPSNSETYNAPTYPAFHLKFGLTFGVSDGANLASLSEFYVTDEQGG